MREREKHQSAASCMLSDQESNPQPRYQPGIEPITFWCMGTCSPGQGAGFGFFEGCLSCTPPMLIKQTKAINPPVKSKFKLSHDPKSIFLHPCCRSRPRACTHTQRTHTHTYNNVLSKIYMLPPIKSRVPSSLL